LVANKAIKKGELLTKDNLTVKRPGCGISPMRIDEIIGTKSKYSFQVNDLIKV
jgi:N,N'-diacetyllegionaminate synthase